MDCSVLCWDFSQGRVRQSFSTQANGATTTSNAQTLNPPFVNSMTFTDDGHHLLVASGNAEVLLYDAKKRIELRRATSHTHSVMHVSTGVVPNFARQHFRGTNYVLSGGNDQTILLWDLQAFIDGPESTASSSSSSSSISSTVAASSIKNRKKREKARAKKKAAYTAADAPTATDQQSDDESDPTQSMAELAISPSNGTGISSSPTAFIGGFISSSSSSLPHPFPYTSLELDALDTSYIRYRWRHPNKMNAIVSATTKRAGTDQGEGLSLYVADTSNIITAYHLQ